MSDSPRYYPLQVERELRRIGVDLERLGGLATADGPPPEEFLRWLRSVPGGIGHDAFLERIDQLESAYAAGVPMPDLSEAPDATTFRDPDVGAALDYHTEFDRVVPPSSIAGRSYAYNRPHGRAHALRILRALPDGAGLDAYLAALQASERDDV